MLEVPEDPAQARAFLTALLGSPSDALRRASAAALSALGAEGQAELLRQLDTGSPLAISACLEHVDPASAPLRGKLVNILGHEVSGFRDQLLSHVLTLEPDYTQEILDAYFDHRLDADVASTTLQNTPPHQRRALIGKLLTNRQYSSLRLSVELLRRLEWSESIAPLLSLYHNTITPVRAHVVEALSEHPTAEVVTLLVRALSDHSREVRNEAVIALGDSGHERAHPHLLALLGSSHVEQRLVIAALGKLKEERAIEPMKKLFVYGDHATKEQILIACHKINTTQALGLLFEGTTDHDPDIRRRANGLLLTTGPRVH